MNAEYKKLDRVRPNSTSATVIFTPRGGVRYIGKLLIVANVSAAKRKFSVYYDDDGTTYDDDSVLYSEIEIPGNTTWEIDFGGVGLPINESSGNLAVQTDVADDINFTLFGDQLS